MPVLNTNTVGELDCGGRRIDLSAPCVMGILNVTPDSFSDGGRFVARDAALRQARCMAEEGAAVIDVGGESTRPGAKGVSVQQELDRVIPIIEALASELPLPLSVDTSKPEVMRDAVRAGAGLINDVNALRAPDALQAAAQAGVPVCLMHMRGEPRTMQADPVYGDVVQDLLGFFELRIAASVDAGIAKEQLLVDPGFGFGKTLRHNLRLLRHLGRFTGFGLPVVVGVSRKSMIGSLLDKPADQRLYGSLAAAVLAAQRGASILRVHDVGPTVDVLKIVASVAGAEQ